AFCSKFLSVCVCGRRSPTIINQYQFLDEDRARHSPKRKKPDGSLPPLSNRAGESHTLASLLSVNTSAGPSEILGLRLEHVRLNESPPEIQIIAGTKNRYRIRHVPLNDKARWAVEQLMARARELGATEPVHYLVPFRICKCSYDPLRHSLSWKSAHIQLS